MSNVTSGLKIQGTVRGTGVNRSNNPFIQLELSSGNGQVQLYRVSTKVNGQKVGDTYSALVSPVVIEGKFFGFREI